MLSKEFVRPIKFPSNASLRIYQFAPDEHGQSLDGVLDRMRNISSVKALAEVFSTWSGKFKFGTTPRNIWTHKYQFSGTGASFESDCIVNGSEQCVRSYVDQISAFAWQRRPPVIMLVGGIGSGKSSFNKYVTTHFHDELKASGVIACRLEFQKLQKHLRAYKTVEPARAIEAFVFGALMRDVALYAYGREGRASDDPFSFAETCRLRRGTTICSDEQSLNLQVLTDQIRNLSEESHYLEHEVKETDIARFFNQFCRYPKMSSAERSGIVAFWAKYMLSEHPSNRKMAAVTEMFLRIIFRDYRPFLIFDGFDYIGVNDFNDDDLLKSTFNWLSDAVVTGEGFDLPISRARISPLLQITLRESTNQLFWRNRFASHSQVNYVVYKVEAPTVEAVVDGLERLIHHLVPADADISPVWSEILNGSINHLHERLRQAEGVRQCDFAPADLFQNNSRHLINFLRDVLEIELDTAHRSLRKRGAMVTSRTLANEMREHYERLAHHSSYVLVQILLSSRSSRYQNFICVSREDGGSLHLEDNDNGSGYIGNVFNFHADYDPSEGLREFTHKLQILALLCKSKLRRSLTDIAEATGFSETFTKTALQVMLRENMLNAWFDTQRRAVLYSASGLGEIILHHLIYELSYVEAVFFGASIPARFMDPDLQDVMRSDGLEAWVTGSFANVLLILRMMKTAGESTIAMTGADPLSAVVDRMIDSLGAAFRRISRSAAGEYLTPDDVNQIVERQNALLD